MESIEHKIVGEVIKFLKDRKGFDDWWYSVDPKTRDELLIELETKIREVLP